MNISSFQFNTQQTNFTCHKVKLAQHKSTLSCGNSYCVTICRHLYDYLINTYGLRLNMYSTKCIHWGITHYTQVLPFWIYIHSFIQCLFRVTTQKRSRSLRG